MLTGSLENTPREVKSVDVNSGTIIQAAKYIESFVIANPGVKKSNIYLGDDSIGQQEKSMKQLELDLEAFVKVHKLSPVVVSFKSSTIGFKINKYDESLSNPVGKVLYDSNDEDIAKQP